ncbi:MAG: ankyrin repeat domain-containing protein, partial [Rickettsiaceae bacterium]|nr:ankyrin repeat domain-containing protein [Rickettsiaceae bacterium]
MPDPIETFENAKNFVRTFPNLERWVYRALERQDINARGPGKTTLLQVVSGCGDLELVKSLIKHGAEIEESDDGGITPLHAASQGGHIDVVKYLVKSGA